MSRRGNSPQLAGEVYECSCPDYQPMTASPLSSELHAHTHTHTLKSKLGRYTSAHKVTPVSVLVLSDTSAISQHVADLSPNRQTNTHREKIRCIDRPHTYQHKPHPPTLEVVDSVLYPDSKGGVILVINAYDGLLQSETTSPGTSLHLVFRLDQRGREERVKREGRGREKRGKRE